jgi:hypothetical protein
MINRNAEQRPLSLCMPSGSPLSSALVGRSFAGRPRHAAALGAGAAPVHLAGSADRRAGCHPGSDGSTRAPGAPGSGPG